MKPSASIARTTAISYQLLAIPGRTLRSGGRASDLRSQAGRFALGGEPQISGLRSDASLWEGKPDISGLRPDASLWGVTSQISALKPDASLWGESLRSQVSGWTPRSRGRASDLRSQAGRFALWGEPQISGLSSQASASRISDPRPADPKPADPGQRARRMTNAQTQETQRYIDILEWTRT